MVPNSSPMRYLFLLLLAVTSCKQDTQDASTQAAYQDIHDSAVFIDTHNDMLTKIVEDSLKFDSDLSGITHSDLDRMRTGGLDAQFFSVWSDGTLEAPFAYANRQIDSLDAVIARNPDKMLKATSSAAIQAAVDQHKLAALIGVEGGHHIENSLEKLDSLYDRGVRYMTLTWNNSTDWATSATDEWDLEGQRNSEGENGLTEFGVAVVHKMNSLGMLIDISHVGVNTFWDVMYETTKPVIASHSSVMALHTHPRNLNDEQLKAIAKNKGVVQVNFYSAFIDSSFNKKHEAFMTRHQKVYDSLIAAGTSAYAAKASLYERFPEEAEKLRAPFEVLMQHITYIVDLVGIDYVGIGSDFDGISFPPQQLDDVTAYPLITKALVDKGYSKADIHKLLGGNLLRVLKANEAQP